MAGVIMTSNHPKLLWPGVNAIWGQVYDEHPVEYTDLYDVETSDRAYEEDLKLTGFGLAAMKSEGGPPTWDSEQTGGVTRYQHIAYSLGYIVTHEELQDNLYEEVSMRRAKANAFSVAQTVETISTFLWNNAFNATYYTTWDGKSMIATDHVNVTGGSFSNELSPGADLSEIALEDMCIQIMQAKNDRSLNIALMPQSLHVAPGEYFNAHRILKSTLQSDTNNNNINVLKAVNAFPKGIKVNHYFTNASSWFVRTNAPNGLKFFWRERPSLSRDNDFHTKNALALAYFRCSFGLTDPLALFGSDRA